MKYLIKSELHFEVEASDLHQAKLVVEEQMKLLDDFATFSDYHIYAWADPQGYHESE